MAAVPESIVLEHIALAHSEGHAALVNLAIAQDCPSLRSTYLTRAAERLARATDGLLGALSAQSLRTAAGETDGDAGATIISSATNEAGKIIEPQPGPSIRCNDCYAPADFSPATRKQRDAIFKQIITTAGNEPLSRMTKAAICAGRDRRKATPNQARHYLDAMRGLCRWAVVSGLIKCDPTDGVRPPRTKRSSGFPVWTADDVAVFERRWPVGTRERLAFDVLRFTGLRRGDAAMLGRQHIRDGIITFRTTKTGETIYIALQPELAATIAAGPCGDLAFITGQAGAQLTKESFGNWFRDACRAAGSEQERTWAQKMVCHHARRPRGHCLRTASGVRMDERPDGTPLHAGGRSTAPRRERNETAH